MSSSNLNFEWKIISETSCWIDRVTDIKGGQDEMVKCDGYFRDHQHSIFFVIQEIKIYQNYLVYVFNVMPDSKNRWSSDDLAFLTLLMLETKHSGFKGSIPCLLMPWHQSISRRGISCVGQTTCIVVPELISSTCCTSNDLDQAKSKIWFKMWLCLI